MPYESLDWAETFRRHVEGCARVCVYTLRSSDEGKERSQTPWNGWSTQKKTHNQVTARKKPDLLALENFFFQISSTYRLSSSIAFDREQFDVIRNCGECMSISLSLALENGICGDPRTNFLWTTTEFRHQLQASGEIRIVAFENSQFASSFHKRKILPEIYGSSSALPDLSTVLYLPMLAKQKEHSS